jgi:hypothetical protein
MARCVDSKYQELINRRGQAHELDEAGAVFPPGVEFFFPDRFHDRPELFAGRRGPDGAVPPPDLDPGRGIFLKELVLDRVLKHRPDEPEVGVAVGRAIRPASRP